MNLKPIMYSPLPSTDCTRTTSHFNTALSIVFNFGIVSSKDVPLMSSNFDAMRKPPVEISLISIRVGFFFVVLLKVYNPPLAFLPYWPAVVARCERISFFLGVYFLGLCFLRYSTIALCGVVGFQEKVAQLLVILSIVLNLILSFNPLCV